MMLTVSMDGQVVYFGRCIPWIIVDAIPYFRKWKIQPNKVPSKKEQWECTKLVLLTHFTVELPQVRLHHSIFLPLNTYSSTPDLALPPHRRILWHVNLPSPLPPTPNNDLPNHPLLHLRRPLALPNPPNAPLRTPLPPYPQTPSPLLRSIRFSS